MHAHVLYIYIYITSKSIVLCSIIQSNAMHLSENQHTYVNHVGCVCPGLLVKCISYVLQHALLFYIISDFSRSDEVTRCVLSIFSFYFIYLYKQLVAAMAILAFELLFSIHRLYYLITKNNTTTRIMYVQKQQCCI